MYVQGMKVIMLSYMQQQPQATEVSNYL